MKQRQRTDKAPLRAAQNVSLPDTHRDILDKILIDERRYGNGEPTWGGQLSAEIANAKRQKLVKRLRKVSGAFAKAAELADSVEKCASRRRCKSQACPECTRAFQRWFVASVSEFARADAKRGHHLVALSLAPPAAYASPGRLSTLDMEKINSELCESLFRDSNVQWGAVCADISLNDLTQKGLKVIWQAQFYGFLKVRDKNELLRTLRAAFPSCEAVSRPVRLRKYDASRYATSYALKTEFVRRISYWDSNGRYPCWHTRKCTLKAREHIELMIMLAECGFEKRVIFYGIEPNS